MTPLSPMERWMVNSNLETIRAGKPVNEQVALLRANGYHRIADAVVQATKNHPGDKLYHKG